MKRHFTHSLRFKVAIGVAFPVLLALSAFSALQYFRERQILIDRLEATAVRLGEVMRGSLRHAMLNRNQEELRQAVVDIGNQESVLRVAIFNAEAQLRVANRPKEFDPPPARWSSPGCVDCHRASGTLQRHSLVVTLPGQAPVLRSSILIPNEPACHECHDASAPNLGVLIADFSLSQLEHDALADLRLNLGLSTAATLLVTAGVYGLAHALIVRRVERFQRPLRQFAHGDFSERVPLGARERDELGDLAGAVNRMAEGLERQVESERRSRQARLEAIVEERQRLGRELHDGLAQVLGYVNTKAMAARLLMRRGQNAEAAEQLRQLEEAARGVFDDLREAILDLKTSVNGERGFAPSLEAYVKRFREQSGIPADLTFEGDAAELTMPAESEVQLLRIVQEALTNVRKHAGAAHAWVRLTPDGGRSATITIGDDGRGFDPSAPERDHRPHFGLGTMRERAEAIGGTMSVDSAPGAGTRIAVTLPLVAEESNLDDNARPGRG